MGSGEVEVQSWQTRRTATPQPPCVVCSTLSPSRPQLLADQLLQVALGSPEETARGRGGNVGSQPPLLGKYMSLPLKPFPQPQNPHL